MLKTIKIIVVVCRQWQSPIISSTTDTVVITNWEGLDRLKELNKWNCNVLPCQITSQWLITVQINHIILLIFLSWWFDSLSTITFSLSCISKWNKKYSKDILCGRNVIFQEIESQCFEQSTLTRSLAQCYRCLQSERGEKRVSSLASRLPRGLWSLPSGTVEFQANRTQETCSRCERGSLSRSSKPWMTL